MIAALYFPTLFLFFQYKSQSLLYFERKQESSSMCQTSTSGVYKFHVKLQQRFSIFTNGRQQTANRCQEDMRLLLQICVLLICISARASQRAKRADFLPYRTGKKVASQVSNALDRLLFFSGYDKQIRPGVSIIFLISYLMWH